jgi:hypothetical protein
VPTYSKVTVNAVLSKVSSQLLQPRSIVLKNKGKTDDERLSFVELLINLFFAQPKYRLACGRPGSGNTKNIGSVTAIEELVKGTGPFAALGEQVYDDYWMYYLTRDMAQALGVRRPYTNLKTYLEYKERGVDTLRAHKKEIAKLAEDEAPRAEEQSE